MNTEIKEFLKKLKFDESEIEILTKIAPVLSETSANVAAENIDIVINAGYPLDDITYLISQNPNFLCRNSAELKNDVLNIIQSHEDFESALKENPYLI